MTFIYLTSFKEKISGSKRCAVAAHLVPTYTSGKYRLDCYKDSQPAVATLRTLTKALELMPYYQDDIKVITSNHELAWDLQQVLIQKEPGFLPKNFWQEFLEAVVSNRMSLSQFQVSESGIMLSSEKQLAREQVEQTKWGFAL